MIFLVSRTIRIKNRKAKWQIELYHRGASREGVKRPFFHCSSGLSDNKTRLRIPQSSLHLNFDCVGLRAMASYFKYVSPCQFYTWINIVQNYVYLLDISKIKQGRNKIMAISCTSYVTTTWLMTALNKYQLRLLKKINKFQY